MCNDPTNMYILQFKKKYFFGQVLNKNAQNYIKVENIILNKFTSKEHWSCP